MTGSHFNRIGVSALAVAALSLTACGGTAERRRRQQQQQRRRQRAEPDADHRL